MKTLNRLALIPARGGSKGIPDKNLRMVGNKSLLDRAIESAVKSKIFSEVCVSTDSLEVAECVKKHGLSVPFFRPPEISGDTSLGIEVIKQAIAFYRNLGVVFDTVTLLQPTSPFRRFNDVVEANKVFDNSPCESLISVLDITNFHASTRYIPLDESLDSSINLRVENFNTRTSAGTLRQNFSKTYWRNGAIYIVKSKNLDNSEMLLAEPIEGYLMPWIRSINIDTFEDLELANIISANFKF
jgi:CMP-N,N'-diacetyllegionaminic acid synthase